MHLTRIAGTCSDRRTCPTVFTTDRDTVVVQGYEMSPIERQNLNLPTGESAVEIPYALLKEVADAVRE